MSKRLEDFIKSHKTDFDDLEPGDELWSSIEAKLPGAAASPVKKEVKTFTLAFVMRVAAITILVMGVAFTLYLKKERSAGPSLAAINPEYAKEQVHYASLVQSKRTELKTLAKSDPQLYTEFSKEIAKMDSTYKRLNNDLATSPNQESVLRAMIRNLQVQTEVLNQQLNVIEQFNEFKNQSNNEIKNI
jgi:hypothetical protein